jgi:vitamin B12 transporter
MWYDTEENLLIPFAEPIRTFVHRKDPFWLFTLSGDSRVVPGVRVKSAVEQPARPECPPDVHRGESRAVPVQPGVSLGGFGNSLPGRAFSVGLVLPPLS